MYFDFAEPEIKWDGENDFDTNEVETERPDEMSEPRRRKMSLGASVISQPGILAGLSFSSHRTSWRTQVCMFALLLLRVHCSLL